ncbi:hypothetical protein FIBSPDRAFT_227389 [Athelia psychrophila]|uniref:Uncharacterized protein n=1 Tax=Athelia psychrophila TaxID=1759441 RepID=A0A165YW37_9AGAM|nr:hypothetical protein FIBSPDRAFT_227389 [Fibularhizoctonia sp. CBS 109695]
MHSRPTTNSVDDPPNRPTEIISSVLQTEESITIQPLGSSRFPSPNMFPYLISASPSPFPVPSPGPSHCDFPGCFIKASGAPLLTNLHKKTKKHRKQLLLEDVVELRMYKCLYCDYEQHRKHTLLRHMGSIACQRRRLRLINRGEAGKKPGRPKGEKGGN